MPPRDSKILKVEIVKTGSNPDPEMMRLNGVVLISKEQARILARALGVWLHKEKR